MKNQLFLICLFLVLAACEKDNYSDNNEYTDYLSGNSISTEIEFLPVEIYENSNIVDTPVLKIRFSTTEIFPCMNYQISSSQFIKGNELIVRFDSIFKPSLCFTAMGPANTMIDLPNNINKLILINGQTIDMYRIDISDEKVDMVTIRKNYTNLKYEKTFRYPENTFAYVCGTNLDNTHLYNDFLNILLDNTSVTEYEFNGDGRIPYPEFSSGHWSDNPSKFFKYNNESDFDKAGDLLRDFTLENISQNDGVGIYLISWNNKSYMSWLFD